MTTTRETLRFGDFELDPADFALRRGGRRVRLERRPMDLLLLLVEHRGRLVTRDQIVERVWGSDVFVDVETGINTLVWKLRTALRDASETPAFIETVPGRGYRFIAPVQAVPGQIPESRGQQPPAPAVMVEPVADAGSRPAPQASVHRLRNAVLISLGLVGIAALVASLMWPRSGSADPPDRLSLAVLPFESLGLPADRQHLAGGLTDEISAWLAQVDPGRLTVRGRTMAYRGTTKSAAEIGRELSVDYLVEGSIASEGSQLRVTVRLIRTSDEEHVWSLPYERRPDTVLGLQEELAATIARQVRLHLSPDRARGLESRQTRNAAAYDEYLRARYAETRRTPEAAQNAERHYKRAIALDPGYALAWSGLAMTHASSAITIDALPLDVGPLARDAARRAVDLNPNLPEAWHASAYVDWLLDWNWEAGEASLRRAIELDGSSAVAHRTLGHLLSQAGRHDEALAAMRQARELEPMDALHHSLSSQVAYQARDYDAAVAHARRALLIDPDLWIGYIELGQGYERLNELDRASEAFADAARRSGRNSKTISYQGYLLGRTLRIQEARATLEMLQSMAAIRYVPPYAMALVHAGLGDDEAVFEWLEKAYAVRDVHLMFLPVDAKWDPYRQDPRFERLLARCGFASGEPPAQPASLTGLAAPRRSRP